MQLDEMRAWHRAYSIFQMYLEMHEDNREAWLFEHGFEGPDVDQHFREIFNFHNLSSSNTAIDYFLSQ